MLIHLLVDDEDGDTTQRIAAEAIERVVNDQYFSEPEWSLRVVDAW